MSYVAYWLKQEGHIVTEKLLQALTQSIIAILVIGGGGVILISNNATEGAVTAIVGIAGVVVGYYFKASVSKE